MTLQVIQSIDLGEEGLIPLELRFLHEPMATEGYVGAALSTNVIRFYKNEVCEHTPTHTHTHTHTHAHTARHLFSSQGH